MRLNPDCIRDILLYVEENTGYMSYIPVPRNVHNFDIVLQNNYEPDEILYHIDLCEEYGYIHTDSGTIANFYIKRLSVLGHEFLENIRQDNNWNQTKSLAKQAGSISLNVISNIASNVISGVVAKHFGL